MPKNLAQKPTSPPVRPAGAPLGEMASRFFESCDSDILAGRLTGEEALAIAGDLVAIRHPQALCSFLFGSAAEGRFGRHSDLDMIVVETDCDFVGTSRLVHRGCPVELHQFSRSAVLHALRSGRESGSHNVAFGLAESVVVTGATGLGAELKELARMIVLGRPAPIGRSLARDLYRTALLSILELSANSNPDERFAMVVALHPVLMNLHLRTEGEWVKGHKWAVRDTPEFAARLTKALRLAVRTGATEGLAALLLDTARDWKAQAWAGTDIEFQAAAPPPPRDHSAS
ncbi:MAG TPA: nucleotidyltransferase domain-containing protein [Allosphingosinicella sp.]